MKHFTLSVSHFIVMLAIIIAGCGAHNDTAKNGADTINATIQAEAKQPDTIPFKADYASVNGITMYYEIHGKGNPLLLIHGGGSTIETTFGRILPLLARTHKIIAVELQAHGHTSDRNAPESFEQDADDVAELLQQLNIASADILGFSNGGQTGMQLAIRHPEKVHKLIIASAFYKRSDVPDQFWQLMNKATFADMPQALKDGFMKIKNDSAALLNMFHKDSYRMKNFKSWTDASVQSIKAPSLLIAGDNDVIRASDAAAMARLIPHCKLAIIPGGHGKYLGEITTLNNGKWTQQYTVPLIEEFLNEGGE